MSVLRAALLRWISPCRMTFKSGRGMSVLDLVITVLVLAVVLLAASYQFSHYEQQATESHVHTATTKPSTKAQR